MGIGLAVVGTSVAWAFAAAWIGCGGDTASSATPGLGDGGDATVTADSGVEPGGGDSAAFDASAGDSGEDAHPDPCRAYVQAVCAVSSRCTGFTPGPNCRLAALAADEQTCRESLAAPGSGQSAALVAQCTASLGASPHTDYLKGKRDPSCTPKEGELP